MLVAELSGSESVIHFDMNGQTWVSQSHGIHPFPVGSTAKLNVDVDRSFFFGGDGRLHRGARLMAKITLDNLRHSYLAEPGATRIMPSRSCRSTGPTAAPTRCSGPRAAARPPCSI